MGGKRGLNPKRVRFVEEYLVDLNATDAAKRAGYSARTAKVIGYELLQDEQVQAAVAAAQADRAERTQTDQDYVIANLREINERCMQRAPVMVREGRLFVQAKDEDGNHVWQFDAAGALGANKLIGMHLGMFITKKLEHSLPAGSGVLAVPVAPGAEQWAAGAAAQQAALVARPSTAPAPEDGS